MPPEGKKNNGCRHMPVELGCVEQNQRYCKLLNWNQIGDKIQFILECRDFSCKEHGSAPNTEDF